MWFFQVMGKTLTLTSAFHPNPGPAQPMFSRKAGNPQAAPIVFVHAYSRFSASKAAVAPVVYVPPSRFAFRFPLSARFDVPLRSQRLNFQRKKSIVGNGSLLFFRPKGGRYDAIP